MILSPLFRRLFIPQLLVICVATLFVGLFAAERLRDSYMESTRTALRDNARLVAQLVEPDLAASAAPGALPARVSAAAGQIKCRITVIRADGRVLAESDPSVDAGQMEPHNSRPEVREAAAQGEGADVRPSATLHREMMYFAHRMEAPSGTYFVRVAIGLDELQAHLRAIHLALASAGLAAILAAGAFSYVVARRNAAPVVELTRFADDLAHGAIRHSGMRAPGGEIGTLSRALDSIGDSLSRHVAQADKDKAELLAILSSMSEGVIATDAAEHILLVNQAAGRLLGFDWQAAAGKLLAQVVRNDQVLKTATRVREGDATERFQVGPLLGRHLEVTVRTYSAQSATQGLIIVAYDATQSVRYQELRKEFVANVSHELRTPLTVIKGFVETLLEGAIAEPEKAMRYLATIERHTNQLANLVNDLLEISRLESQPDTPRSSPVDPQQLVKKSIELLAPAAQKKGHTLSFAFSGHLPMLRGNPDYLERALTNLIDNAIKYTPAGGKVDVGAHVEGRQLVIEVCDNGLGIPQEDISRIFERFYRVDRSRSREMGGTGLGLSIVKHIVQAHNGAIEVESKPGQGSTFRMRLPLPGEAQA